MKLSHPGLFFLSIPSLTPPMPIRRGILIPLLLLLLAACTPSAPEVNNDQLFSRTEQIARDYQASGDLEEARRALDALDVANPNQWLLLAMESQRGEGDEENLQALSELASALGITARALRAQSSVPVAGDVGASVAQAVDRTNEAAPAAEPTATPTELPAEIPATATPVPADSPTDTPEPSPTSAATATPTTVAAPMVQLSSPMNVRAGPGTNYPVVAGLQAGATAPIIGRDGSGDWWQIQLEGGSPGWIYGPLVESTGETSSVALANDIPTPPPPTPTPVPQPTSPPAPAEPEPEPEAPPADPAPAAGGPDFRLTKVRLWDVEENGGHFAGTSVNCGEKQVIRVIVRDAGNNPLNGVVVKGVYRNELHTTGEKGPGIAEYDVNVDGDDIVVFRDVDGREVSSGRASGLTAKTYNISHDQLIQGKFCTDSASCDAFIGTNGCFGHFSWTVEFQRNY